MSVFNRWYGAGPMHGIHARDDIPIGRLRNRWDQRHSECYYYNSVNSSQQFSSHVASKQSQSCNLASSQCGPPIPHKQAWSQHSTHSSVQSSSSSIPVPRTFTECSVPVLQKHLVFNSAASKPHISSAVDQETVSAVGRYGTNAPSVATLAGVSSDWNDIKGSCISSIAERYGTTCNISALSLPSLMERSGSSISTFQRKLPGPSFLTSTIEHCVPSTSASPRKHCTSNVPSKQFSFNMSSPLRKQSDELNISTSQCASSILFSPKEQSGSSFSSPMKNGDPNTFVSPRKQCAPNVSASPRKQFSSSISSPRKQSDELNISTLQCGSSISISRKEQFGSSISASPRKQCTPNVSASPRKQLSSSISSPRKQSDELNTSTLQSGSSILISPKEQFGPASPRKQCTPKISTSPGKKFTSSMSSPPRKQSGGLDISISQSGPRISASPRKQFSSSISSPAKKQSDELNISTSQSGSSISISPKEQFGAIISASPKKQCTPDISTSSRKQFTSSISSPTRKRSDELNSSASPFESNISMLPKEQFGPNISASPKKGCALNISTSSRKQSRSGILSPPMTHSNELSNSTSQSGYSISTSTFPLEQCGPCISVSPSKQAKPIISVSPKEQMKCDFAMSKGNVSTPTQGQSGTGVSSFTSEHCKLSNSTKSDVPTYISDPSGAIFNITSVSTLSDKHTEFEISVARNGFTTIVLPSQNSSEFGISKCTIEEAESSKTMPQNGNVECILAASPKKQIESSTQTSQNREIGSSNILTSCINQIGSAFSNEQIGFCTSSSSKKQTESSILTPQIKQTLLNIILEKQTASNMLSGSINLIQPPGHSTINPLSEGAEPLNQMILNHEANINLPSEESEMAPTVSENIITNLVDHKTESNANTRPVSLQNGDFTIQCNEAMPNSVVFVRITEPVPGDALSINPKNFATHITFPTSSASCSTQIPMAAPFDPSTIVNAFQSIPVTTTDPLSVPVSTIDATFPPVSSTVDTTLIPVSTIDTTSISVSTIDGTSTLVTTDDTSSAPVSTVDDASCIVSNLDPMPVLLSTVDVSSSTQVATVNNATFPPVSSADTTSTSVSTYDDSSTPVSNVPVSILVSTVDAYIPVSTVNTTLTPDSTVDTTLISVSTVDGTSTLVTTDDASSTPVSTVDTTSILFTTVDASCTPVATVDDATFPPVSKVDALSTPVSNVDPLSIPVYVDAMYNYTLTTVDATSTPVTAVDVDASSTFLTTVDASHIPVTIVDATSTPVTSVDATCAPTTTIDAMTIPVCFVDASSIPVTTFDATPVTYVDTKCTHITSVDVTAITDRAVDEASTTATSVDAGFKFTSVDASLVPLASKMQGPSVGVKRKQSSCTSVEKSQALSPAHKGRQQVSSPACKRRQQAPLPFQKKTLQESSSSVQMKGTKRARNELYIDLTSTEDLPLTKKISKRSCRMSIRKPSSAAITQPPEPHLSSPSQTSPLTLASPSYSECYTPPPRSLPHLSHCCYLQDGCLCGEPVDPQSHRLCVYHYDMQQGLKRFLRLLPPLECNDSNAKPSPKEPLCLSVGLSTEQPSPPENGHIPPSKMEQVSSSETEQVSPSETEQVSKSMEGLSPSKMWQISRSVMGQVPSSVIEQVSSEMGLLSLPKMRQISPPVMGLVTPSELEQVSSELGQLSPSQVGQMSSDTRKRPELKWELAKLDEQRSNMQLELEQLSCKVIDIRSRAQNLLEILKRTERHLELTTEYTERANLQSSMTEMCKSEVM
ncbi:hypothetical protein EMCRGX_G035059 [Ephydatia muelleri]